MMAVSSGTSGEATYWPRSICQDVEAATTHELVFRYLFDIDKISTLIVVCFPMGVYVSGMATVLPTWLMANGRYNVTCVTVGNNQAESLRAVKHLQREYQQLILIGHPFFIKDVIETGIQVGINWAARSLRLMFCSGSFSEEWRQYVMRKGHIRNAESVISTYGCSEMLLIGHETPLSIFVRNTALRPSRSRELLQRDDIMPSLFQYNPVLRFIETVGQELVFTSASGTPLIRFNLHDRGEVLPFRKVTAAVSRDVPLWKTEVRSLWRLPFVTLYGRTDYTVKFYGANIYPEHIHMALHQKNLLRSLTGKFVMMKRCQPNLDELLEIHVELRSGMAPEAKLTGQIQEEVVRQLMLVNREYSDTLQHHVGRDLRPRITLWRYQKEPHFRPGLKPHYIGSSTKGR